MFLGFGIAIPLSFSATCLAFTAFAVTLFLIIGVQQVLRAR